ncbi:MAG: hypothetical protein MPJ50_07125 [Pirellulales bacterium]|nr:hypothetical protein [Pirellulales bacterium]
MDSNPYESPAASGLPPQAHEDVQQLFKLAKAQRVVCFTILFGLISSGVAIWARNHDLPVMQVLGLAVLIFVGIAQAVAMFMLAFQAYRSIIPGLILIVLAIFPFFGLVALAYVNQKATERLKANRVRVGFMGPPKSEIARLQASLLE